ncbi:uncharacterized protein BO88DRAFT_408770 [Aspergillus vadensis CBS 113365]|uniref:Uncharacterized protein n=1 Tax=Aspergillus vadensis (strain CBS 113365 / IMI 142717 / IBT 24658) TaxID=1448311 RepID=A0A319AUR0_ASPVC|nr:hypothetical protein BO88DRAFT_408770 [Aspergillus vadensis CBS 113365]PYH64097.1 hypothetical protein BO88DRAFT_408770 [Aspergillus vadensis CBS 113365]
MWLVKFNHCGSHFRIVCFACLLVGYLVDCGCDCEFRVGNSFGRYLSLLFVSTTEYTFGG